MKNSVRLGLILLLTSCGVIMINENNYRLVTDSKKNQIRPFDIELLNQRVNNAEHLILYEINTNDIKNCISKYKYVWLHLWRPFCPSEYCKNINYFLNTERNLKHYNMEFLLVSESYDFNSIENAVTNSFYDKAIFVLQDSYYGHKIKPNRLKLYSELMTEDSPLTRIGFDDYLFEDAVLIFAGDGLNEHKIDSLITNINR